MDELTGKQIEKLRDALVDAFPGKDLLIQMVRFGLNENLAAIVASDGSLKNMVFDLITLWAEPQSRTDELIIAAREYNPRNPALRAVAEELKLAASSARLESIVRKTVGFAIGDEWREKMSACEVTVCQVDTPYESGTGFLLGRSVAITCHHVMKKVIQNPKSRSEVILRFDYKSPPDKSTLRKGRDYHLAEDWEVDKSPSDELDYVLMRVEGTPGDDSIGNQTQAPPRGWINPQANQFEKGDPLFIIQHPKALPLCFAPGSITDSNPAQSRITYDVNTEPGSSGSPCFTSNWELLALHQSGAQTANHGILFSAILNQPKVQAALGT